jgi:hypothetical protein
MLVGGDGGLDDEGRRNWVSWKQYILFGEGKTDEQVISVAKCIVKWVHYIKLGIIYDMGDKPTKSQACTIGGHCRPDGKAHLRSRGQQAKKYIT